LTDQDTRRRDSEAGARRPARADAIVKVVGLVPLRLFLGVTYLYAGIVKFADPHFLAVGDPFSVAAQMEGYARTSPLAPLITASLPAALAIGFLIAVAELAIGLGVLTGLSFRLAASAGAALSLLFWLTASWSSSPYFYSPDLPYLLGFLTLALVGHGGLYVLDPSRRGGAPAARAVPAADGTAGTDPSTAHLAAASPASSTRRSVLQVGLLAGLTLLVTAALAPLRLLGSGSTGQVPAKTPRPTPPAATPTTAPATPGATAAPATAAPATAAPPTPAPTAPPAVAPAGPIIGTMADFGSRNGIAFTVPFESPTEMGPGAPGIMVELPDGSVVAYNAICTHGRCTVGFDSMTNMLQCPCHTARFDPGAGAAVLSGPAPSPLIPIPVAVDAATGDIHVTLPA
jgi:thiosulfate dehydrogenase (quinone) large subunit